MSEELKLGDIRQFKMGDEEKIGVVCQIHKSFYIIYTFEGVPNRIFKFWNSQIVKLSSEEREYFNELSKHIIKRDNYRKKISELEFEIDVEGAEIHRILNERQRKIES